MYLLQLGERVYGRRDPRQVPILCFVGGWYADAGDFIGARAIYRHALALVEQKLGPNDPAAVEPLRALAGYVHAGGLLLDARESGRRARADADRRGRRQQRVEGASTRGTWTAKARRRWSAP